MTADERNRKAGDKALDFIETLLRFLGNKDAVVISFIRMKLAQRKRRMFDLDMDACRNVREKAQCLKKYIGHLTVNDARALLKSLPEMLAGKIEALTFHGELAPENRLMKFAKTFDLSDADVMFCMLFFLITGGNTGRSLESGVGRAV